MLYLALDTATDRPTLALGKGGETSERALAHRRDLSRDIDGATRDLLAARQVTPAAIEGVVVADGPGSFTGLRIGIAFAKGLCRALGVPLYAVPSMLGAAYRASGGAGLVAVDYDALRGQVYRAVYRLGGDAVAVIAAPGLVSADAAPPAGALRADQTDASASALLSLLAWRGGPARVTDPPSWEPSYGRPAEAEARLRARHAAG